MSSKKQLNIGIFLQGVGHSIAWRDPQHSKFTDFDTYVRFAQTAERGLIDFIFFGEGLVVREHREKFFGPIVNGRPDTLALLPALAAYTKHIGLAATVSSTYNEPYELARKFASIDHVSNGRAAWNVVTSFSNSVAKDSGGDQIAFNFSKEKHLEHATRYDRAREVVALIKKLWDSWEDDAFVDGELQAERIHSINHEGKWFQVRGPFDIPRSPQGHPVIIQAGQSPDGRDLAARIADVVFTPHRNIDEAKAYYDDLRQRLIGYGRSPDDLRVLPGLAVIAAPTEAEAKDLAEHYNQLLHSDEIARYLLGEQSGLDFTDVDLDAPFPELDPNHPDANKPLVEGWISQARAQNLTTRQIAEQVRPRLPLAGSPVQIADHFQHWFEAGASDGFLLTPTHFPNDVEAFVDLVVPELQNRGLFRSEYSGSTLRENLGVPRPVSASQRNAINGD